MLRQAAQYLRMSTDHQRYSIETQQAFIGDFADSHGIHLAKTYADTGKSGVSLRNRDGLKQLLSDVRNGITCFDLILVYDTSRWGRFQDPDEAAFHEWICRKAGYDVIYCAEPFGSAPGPFSAILKGMKRVMAAEFSRELSVKVSAGLARNARQGFCNGGRCGFGLRRAIVGRDGLPSLVLEHGQRKHIRSERAVYVPGPPEEVALVRRVFRMFVEEARSEHDIATTLNSEGYASSLGRRWKSRVITRMLTYEGYQGIFNWGHSSSKFGGPRVMNSPDCWIRIENVFQPIIEKAQFERAQEIFVNRRHALSDEEMLRRLKILLADRGTLTAKMIDASKQMPSSRSFASRFGSIVEAYALVGFLFHNYQTDERTLRYRKEMAATAARQLEAAGAWVSVSPDARRMTINAKMVVGIVALYAFKPRRTFPRYWRLQRPLAPIPDFMIVARLHPETQSILDYLVIPMHTLGDRKVMHLALGGPHLEPYRSDTLDCVARLGETISLTTLDHLEDAYAC